MALIRNVLLNTGSKMPLLGFGTWLAPESKIQACVETAIDVGYRHIDGAWAYQNEKGTGLALKKKIKEGTIEREDVFITSKLYCTFFKPSQVRICIEETLGNLQTNYVNLYLMHWPFAMPNINKQILPLDENGKILSDDTDYVSTWKVMEELHKEGLAKNIGVSNFNTYQLNRVLNEGTIVPAINQIESHPYLQENTLIAFCKSKDIQVTAYSPLGSPGRPWATVNDPIVMEDPTLVKIAGKYSKTVAQVMIRFQIQRGITVIPKSSDVARIKENAQVFDFALTDDEMEAIAEINKDLRLVPMENASHLKYWPFRPNYSE